jgi:outer membrane lipoprotein-sorting protein
VEKDLVTVPTLHDTPSELAQGLDVKDWKKGECEPIPNKTLPNLVVVERDYPNTYKKFTALGPLLKKIGNQAATGTLFVPPATVRQLDMKDSLFGSDVSYADVLENFFAWPNQVIIGNEIVNCQILESKPGKGHRSNYASVRTWVDIKRMVPLRVEKYNTAGQMMRRIDSGRIVTDDIGRHVPAGLTVTDPSDGSSTELDGSKLKHDVPFTADEFTPEGLKQRSESR